MKSLITAVSVFVALFALNSATYAQGGWRQWTVHMRDGTQLEANPLGMNEAGRFTRGMGNQEGIERSKIALLSIRQNELPPLPEGEFDKDLVVLTDGTRTFGAVKFREFKFSEGTIIQNGKEIGTGNIAYIKFAKPKKKPATKRST